VAGDGQPNYREKKRLEFKLNRERKIFAQKKEGCVTNKNSSGRAIKTTSTPLKGTPSGGKGGLHGKGNKRSGAKEDVAHREGGPNSTWRRE